MRLIFVVFLLVFLQACAVSNRHFWEIPSPDLAHPAMIRDDPRHGTAVIYNSRLCEADPAACGFFRAHAHAHSMLNHPILPPKGYPASQIAGADCWATRNSSPEEIAAAIRYLEDGVRDPDLTITGDPEQRVQNIRECAEKAGKKIASR